MACQSFDQMPMLLACMRWSLVLLVATGSFRVIHADQDEVSPKIVGGVPAEEGEFDFFGIPNRFFCGGSLIHAQIFLTAAHCECGYVDSAREIILGSIRRLDSDSALDIVPLAAERVVHPNYDSRTLENDILLLKLSRPASSAIVPASWATVEPSAGDTTTAIGFGATREGGASSANLLKVDVPVVSFSTCNSASYYDGAIYEDEMLCAGETGKDACQGDSGGPLLNEQGQIVGITSWGDGCARQRRPGVYTNVASYNTFIRQSICALADDKPSYCSSLNFANIRVDTGGDCGGGGGGGGICEGDFLSCSFDLFIRFAGAVLSCFF